MQGLLETFCTRFNETAEVVRKIMPPDLTDNMRREISKGVQKFLETGLPDIENKGEKMPKHPAEVEAVVRPASDLKDGQYDLLEAFRSRAEETFEEVRKIMPPDLTDNVRREVSKGLQKLVETGLPDIENKGETTLKRAAEVELPDRPAPDFKEGEDVYSMSRKPRGKCIIINNQKFEGNRVPRLGSEKDVDKMKRLFTEFYFDVCIGTDLKAAEMKRMLSKHAEDQRKEKPDCLVVIIMSHGLCEKIEGVDGEFLHLTDDVYSLFNNENCAALQGKPKIFFIQACQGKNYDKGSPAVQAIVDTSSDGQKPPIPPAISPASDKRTPSWADMFFAHATIPGYVAHRNSEIGSWFISSVYDVFHREAGTMHLQDMMRLVEREVMARSAHDGSRQTASTNTRGWTKALYFNPGHFR